MSLESAMSEKVLKPGTGKTVLIMAGGTGGHIFPALSIADYLQEQGYRIEWLGTRRGLEVQVLQDTGIPLHFLEVSGLRGKGGAGLALAPLMLVRATLQALSIVRRIKPCCVLGMGGYVTGPGGLAAKAAGRSLLIHEQNAIAGVSNRLLAKVADKVMQAFPGTFSGVKIARLLTTGNPVRKEIRQIAEPERRLADRTGPLRILVLGGSLGAVAINRMIPEVLARFAPAERPRVVHQAGNKNIDETQSWYQAQGLMDCEVVPFIRDMAAAYAEADLVVCRAGAITVSELAAVGIASVLVPYPHAVDDHQTKNAGWLVDAGAAVLVQQKDLDADALFALLSRLQSDRPRLLGMAKNARAIAQPDATEQVAAACMEYCHA